MSCIKSFNFVSGANATITGAKLTSWGSASNNYFIYDSGSDNSTFLIQGFKNVNIHGIEAVGGVGGRGGLGFACLVDDWSFSLKINGEVSRISGSVLAAPNNFSISVDNPNVQYVSLSKYTPSIKFIDPVQSVTNIQIINQGVSGYGQETLGTVHLQWGINFVVYYSYEGE